MSIFPTKILLATDGSEEATFAARTAVDVAHKTNSELHVVHVKPPLYYAAGYGDVPYAGEEALQIQQEELDSKAQTLLDTQVEQIQAAGGTVTQAHLRAGKPDEEIVALGEEIGAGLIIMGSRGFSRLRRALIGSVSDSVVRHAHSPVWVMRQEKLEEAAGPEEVGLA
jgi:nucleotide-binding universal stress UspA family protein